LQQATLKVKSVCKTDFLTGDSQRWQTLPGATPLLQSGGMSQKSNLLAKINDCPSKHLLFGRTEFGLPTCFL